MTRATHSIADVKAAVLKFQESGLNVATYSRQNNISPNQLRWFIKRLDNQKFKQKKQQKTGFTKIPDIINTEKSIIRIRCHNFEIEIQDDVNQRTLEKVIKALEKRHV